MLEVLTVKDNTQKQAGVSTASGILNKKNCTGYMAVQFFGYQNPIRHG